MARFIDLAAPNFGVQEWSGIEPPNGKSLYIRSMEVFQMIDDDPIAAKYVEMAVQSGGNEEDAISFN